MLLEYQHTPVCGMNYLETGLPHTDFCRRKTDFSPPRYIPLCGGLGRKYLGLEPLTRREMGVLVKRLSEPKKSAESEEQISVFTQVRRIPHNGTGRFVGQKKMSSFEIEKMVDRLYSRRATKDYAFVDETVEAGDILNMTNGASDSEDESEETKVEKNRENSLLRRQSSGKVNMEQERKRSPTMRRESTCTTPHEPSKSVKIHALPEVKESIASPTVKIDNKPRMSVSFQRPKSLIDSRRKVNENQHSIDKNVTKTSDSSSLTKPEIKGSPLPTGPRRCKSELVNPEKTNETKNTKVSQNFMDFPRSYTAELTRPSPSSVEIPMLVGVGDAPVSAEVDPALTKCEISTSEHNEKKSENPKSPRVSKSLNDSPRQKFSKTEDSKPPRFSAAPCDELLIDRVAIYNRSPKLRCK